MAMASPISAARNLTITETSVALASGQTARKVVGMATMAISSGTSAIHEAKTKASTSSAPPPAISASTARLAPPLLALRRRPRRAARRARSRRRPTADGDAGDRRLGPLGLGLPGIHPAARRGRPGARRGPARPGRARRRDGRRIAGARHRARCAARRRCRRGQGRRRKPGHRGAVAAGGALLVLAFVFASWMAIVPLLMAIVAIPTTFLLIWPLATATDVSVIVKFLAALIGLAIAIDYALLVVVRWREERLRPGTTNEAAVVQAMQHAGRAVVFSGSTVGISLLALVVLPVPFLRSLGIAGMLIPLVSVAVAVTLLPVVLATIGPRLDRRHTGRTDRASRGWSAWARVVVRHRWVAAVASTARPGRARRRGLLDPARQPARRLAGPVRPGARRARSAHRLGHRHRAALAVRRTGALRRSRGSSRVPSPRSTASRARSPRPTGAGAPAPWSRSSRPTTATRPRAAQRSIASARPPITCPPTS